jgi:hypothetical protein
MTSKSKRISSIALVATLAVVAAVALSGAAAADTTTLAGDGTDYSTDFNASEDDFATYTLSSSGTDFGTDGTTTVRLNMTVNDEHVSVSNSSIASTDTSYTFNVSQSEMGTIPGDANSNTTVTVNAWGEDDGGNVTTPVTTFDWTVKFEDGYAVIYAGDTAASGDLADREVETTTESTWLGLGSESASTTVEADNVGLGDNASGTTVHVVVANQSGETPFDAATDGGFLSSYDSEEAFMPTHQVRVEGHPHAAFNTAAPDDLSDDYTYATVGERGGHDAYTVHVADDYEGESNVDVETVANDEYGPITSFRVERNALGTTSAISPLTTTPGVAAP